MTVSRVSCPLLEDLSGLIGNPRVPLSWRRKMLVAYDVLKAIGSLHEAELIHRDIKTENVLVGGGPARVPGAGPRPCHRLHSVVWEFEFGVTIAGAGKRELGVPLCHVVQVDGDWRCVVCDYGFARKGGGGGKVRGFRWRPG